MTKVILSTGNIMSGGPSIIHKRGATNRSNLELLNSLRDSITHAQVDYAPSTNGSAVPPSQSQQQQPPTPLDVWTEREDDAIFIPRINWEGAGLRDEQSQYEITVKMFFLSEQSIDERQKHAVRALNLVRKELGVEIIDLLVVSFPGLRFEGGCEVEADRLNARQGDLEQELSTWKLFEDMYTQGVVSGLGVAEYGSEKLRAFIERATVKPVVDQINLKDTCSVPSALRQLAEEQGVELNVHSDSTDILPCGTLREILGPQGAGVLAESPDGDKGLKGDLSPQWVARYVAFIRDRGVVENKGYFAGANWEEQQ